VPVVAFFTRGLVGNFIAADRKGALIGARGGRRTLVASFRTFDSTVATNGVRGSCRC
jgi:hypothetical protein